MDDLSMALVRLCKRNKDGAFGTQKNRQRGLTAMAKELVDLGYKLPKANSIKPKHVSALMESWQSQDLTTATIRNRLSWLRWWAEKVDKAPVVARDNDVYGIAVVKNRKRNRAQALDTSKLNKITCPYVRVSLMLQSAFGLRREEAMKIKPAMAGGRDVLKLKGTWCKGGRYREIPITETFQHQVLHAARQLARNGSLIPPGKSYAQQMKHYEYQTQKSGQRNTHGLRHRYAQWRFQKLTGAVCPLAGGKYWHEMTKKEQQLDREARALISKELGIAACRSRISI